VAGVTLVHILRAPSTAKWDVEGILATLDKYELRYVRRHLCGGCDMRLDYAGCGTFFAAEFGVCSQNVRVRRLENLLATYKPRPNRRKKR
jgi:hypothetical protein